MIDPDGPVERIMRLAEEFRDVCVARILAAQRGTGEYPALEVMKAEARARLRGEVERLCRSERLLREVAGAVEEAERRGLQRLTGAIFLPSTRDELRAALAPPAGGSGAADETPIGARACEVCDGARSGVYDEACPRCGGSGSVAVDENGDDVEEPGGSGEVAAAPSGREEGADG